jgi:hypothetical protein
MSVYASTGHAKTRNNILSKYHGRDDKSAITKGSRKGESEVTMDTRNDKSANTMGTRNGKSYVTMGTHDGKLEVTEGTHVGADKYANSLMKKYRYCTCIYHLAAKFVF